MNILQATAIQKQYGAKTILDFESFHVYEGDKIGIVGANGTGKSTLLGILCGDIAPDSGHVDRRAEVAVIRQLPCQEGTLSGGENAKLQIQRETHRGSTIVFADEPTANLDEQGVCWVREKLLAAKTVLLVSHDRDLLNEICNQIVEVRDGALHHYTGNYSDYEKQILDRKAKQQMEHARYRRQKAQLETAVQAHETHVAKQRQKKRREMAANSSEARLGGHKRAASMKKQQRIAKVLENRLERLDVVDRVREPAKISIDFSLTKPPEGKRVITCNDLQFSYGNKTIFSGASFTIQNGAHIAITGKNGAGKSTLLQLIRDGHPAIYSVPKFKPGFLYQNFENLAMQSTVLENVLSTSIQDRATVRNILAGLLFRGDDVFKKADVLSGGEKMRLSIAKLVCANNNALLLDEPSNYLDIRSLEAVEAVLRDYPGTLLLVSHDRRFAGAVTTEVLRIENGRINPVSAVAGTTPDRAQKTLLELRRMQLLNKLSSAPPAQKELLEQEYRQITSQLQALS